MEDCSSTATAPLIADAGFARVRRISASDGTITTIAGSGGTTITSNSGVATSTAIGVPFGVAVGPDGSVYIAAEDVDLGGTDSRIWKVAPDQTISTIAGGSVSGFSGDNGPATSAQLKGPNAVAVDPAGNVFIADSYNYRVRRINASDGKIVTIAGTGVAGLSGDNGPAISAQLSEPKSLALDSSGNLYIGDLENARIRMVAPNGTITTFSTVGGHAELRRALQGSSLRASKESPRVFPSISFCQSPASRRLLQAFRGTITPESPRLSTLDPWR